MRGYPIGGFLSWKVEPETIKQFRFYGFLKDYSEYDQFHCPSLDVPPDQTGHGHPAMASNASHR